jgi:AcrR family transcriptional regulator
VAKSPSTTEGDVRRRLARAWAESLPVRGYRRTTVQRLVELSGISRSVFYRHFEGKEHAFVKVHGEALDRLGVKVEAAAASAGEWPHRVRAGLTAGLRALAENPDDAQLLLGDPMGAGPRMGYCQDTLGNRFGPCLAAGRGLAQQAEPPPLIEAALVGGLMGVVSARLHADDVGSLPGLAGPLTEFALAPYLGVAEAQRLAATEPPGGR